MQKIPLSSLNNLSLSYIIYHTYFTLKGTGYVYTKVFAIVACFNGMSATYISDNLYIQFIL